MSTVVVVESPAKAKTINKYLGPDYTVIASYGHVRDLPAKDGSVKPDADFAMEWEEDDKAKSRLSDLAKQVKGATRLYLATDPDREGEAISWHVKDCLARRGALKGVDVKRITFHEITKSAIQDAIRQPRDIDQDLVDAYLARRALDYLVGFTLSPVLWRKLPGSRSAGRVQSVALRLICEREAEIEAFRSEEYWTVDALLATAAGATFSARLTHLDGKKLGKMDLHTETEARAAAAAIDAAKLSVAEVERKTVKRNPGPPFTTSTLQQEASRKLGFSASQTMKIAQRLYEGVDVGGETVGLITYMRTDGVQLSGEAIAQTRRLIDTDFGARYVPDSPRVYKSKAKNAQEAHEAIRPTDLFRRPDQVARYLEPEQKRLYELIWTRTVACQMAAAELDQTAVDITGARVTLRATGSIVKFDGFLRVYEEGRDDKAKPAPDDLDDDAAGRRLPDLAKGQALERRETRPEQHFTQPPPRYTEASLVKKMEELGIGRPSTYASIIQVLQDRDYVKLEQKRFTPEDRGRIVTVFLTQFFERYVEYGFTADLEQQLDEVSDGKADWRAVLRAFWVPFLGAVEGTRELPLGKVIEALDETLSGHFFRPGPDGRDPRVCPSCGTGRLGLKLGKLGAFIGCSNYPECRHTRALTVSGEGEDELAQPREIGRDPVTDQAVTLRKGPYGVYVQLGEGDGDKVKPKRVSLPRGLAPQDVDLDRALGLLSLPRNIGVHPETGLAISAGIGRFGPYLKHGPAYKSLTKDDDVLTIGMNRAVTLLAEEKRAGRGGVAAAPLRVLGPHPADGKDVNLMKGRYGPYVTWSGVNATLPKTVEPEILTLEEAIALLAAKGPPTGAKGKGAKGKTAKAPAKKATEADDAKPTRKATAKTSAASAEGDSPAPAKKAPAKKTTARAAAADPKPARPRAAKVSGSKVSG